jgi:hypothetical protein
LILIDNSYILIYNSYILVYTGSNPTSNMAICIYTLMRICISIKAISQVNVDAPSHHRPTQTAGTISYPIAAVGAAIAAPDRPLLCPHADTSAMDTVSGCAHRRGKTSTSSPSPNDNGALDAVCLELRTGRGRVRPAPSARPP